MSERPTTDWLDDVLRTHAERAKHAPLPADSFDRLAASASPSAPADVAELAGRRRTRALPLVAAAASIAVIAGFVALTQRDGNDVDNVIVGEPAADPAADPAGADAVATRLAPDAPIPRTAVVLVDRDNDGMGDISLLHDLAVLSPDLAAGLAPRSLVDEYMDEPAKGPSEGGLSGWVDADVTANGSIIAEECCEPAVGQIFRIDPATGERTSLVFGATASMSPDELHLVYADPTGVRAVEFGDMNEALVVDDPDNSYQSLEWSPDGLKIAMARRRTWQASDTVASYALFERAGDGALMTPTIHPLPEGLISPHFLANGTIVAGADLWIEGSDAGVTSDVWTTTILDPATGETLHERTWDLPIINIDVSADGEWILLTDVGGGLHAMDPAGAVGRLGDVPPGSKAFW